MVRGQRFDSLSGRPCRRANRGAQAYVKDGEIVLNLSAGAVRNLEMGNEMITCNGRFGGSPFDLMVPVAAVIGIFAKETGQGLVFQGSDPNNRTLPIIAMRRVNPSRTNPI